MTGLRAFALVWVFDMRVTARKLLRAGLAGCGGLLVLIGVCAGIGVRLPAGRVEVVVEDPSLRASLDATGEHDRELRHTIWREAPSARADAVVWVPADPLRDPWRVDAADPASAAKGRAQARELQEALRREALGPPDPEARDPVEPPGFAAGLLMGAMLLAGGAVLSFAVRTKRVGAHVALALGLPRRAVWLARRADHAGMGLLGLGVLGCMAGLFGTAGAGFGVSSLAAMGIGYAGSEGLDRLPDGVARRFLPLGLGLGGLLALLTPASLVPVWGLAPGVPAFAVGLPEGVMGPLGLLHGALALAALWVVAGLEPGGDGSGGIA